MAVLSWAVLIFGAIAATVAGFGAVLLLLSVALDHWVPWLSED
jgi:hypothetical protein